jgi:hypothetical protein
MEVLDGFVPSVLFEVYSQCNSSTTAAEFEARLTGARASEETKGDDTVDATTYYNWCTNTLGLYPLRVGRFWFSNTLQRSRWEQLQVIEGYYTDELIETQLLPLINKHGYGFEAGTGKRVSLRVLDWLVTNFSKKNRIIYTLQLADGKAVPFNLYLQYKSSLNRYKRHVFDPFRRHKRVYFIHKERMYSTTVGQLNFMHWAFEHNIIEYAQSRMAEIEADMTQCIKENQRDKESFKKKGKKRSRKPLCNINPRKCFVYSCEESVAFVQTSPKKIKM